MASSSTYSASESPKVRTSLAGDAMAGRVCIAQVEELVEPGEIDPDSVHLPGVYVHRLVHVGTDIEKRIERRTVTEPAAAPSGTPSGKEG